MSAPTTPDLVTLRLPRDVAREYLRALEELTAYAEETAPFMPNDFRRESLSVARDAQPLRDALHAELYCEVET